MLAAVTVWLVDYNLCVFINGVSQESKWNLQLHAWWHLLSAYGVYGESVLVMYYHYDIRGEKPHVYMWKGFLPAVTLLQPLRPVEKPGEKKRD